MVQLEKAKWICALVAAALIVTLAVFFTVELRAENGRPPCIRWENRTTFIIIDGTVRPLVTLVCAERAADAS